MKSKNLIAALQEFLKKYAEEEEVTESAESAPRDFEVLNEKETALTRGGSLADCTCHAGGTFVNEQPPPKENKCQCVGGQSYSTPVKA